MPWFNFPRPTWAPLLAASVVLPTVAQTAAQTAAPTPEPTASAPAAQRVDITAERANEVEQRRQSTAAKIIIGRDDIERFGDSTTSEILKRLPGVTAPGPAGRGGPPRLRGMGGGYTQLLIDGERIAPGFSLDSIPPEQIERIEILRAPTAETGARAIAGTINIVLREGFRKRLNDLRVGSHFEAGRASPGFSWTRNDSIDDLVYSVSLNGFRRNTQNQSRTDTERRDAAGTLTQDQSESSFSTDHRSGVNLNARLQWRLGEGESLLLTPLAIHSEGQSERNTELVTRVGTPLYDASHTLAPNRFTLLRLNAQLNQRTAGGTRLEWRAGASQARSRGQSLRQEFSDGTLRTIEDHTATRDLNTTAGLKASTLLAESHSLVAGAEIEANQRRESRTSLEDGVRPSTLDDFGENFDATSRRIALYAQDEWSISPQWAAHAGLRWESITTEGDAGNGSTRRNRSQVATPLLHAVYKFDPKSRDQIRISLTRSYRSPTLQNLIARPSLAANNDATRPDRYGNPDLKPELATGIDLALERYLTEGGVLSANLFRRNISNLIRSQVSLNAGSGRYESRPVNVGDALSQGLELEATFRLNDVFADAPSVDLRANASVLHSRVKSVPGPDNRLDQQPAVTANIGADYRLRSVPLTLGGNLNWTPGYTTRVLQEQTVRQGSKTVADAYALWVFNPALQVRLSAGNLAPRDYVTANEVLLGGIDERATSSARSYVNWQLRVEMKL